MGKDGQNMEGTTLILVGLGLSVVTGFLIYYWCKYTNHAESPSYNGFIATTVFPVCIGISVLITAEIFAECIASGIGHHSKNMDTPERRVYTIDVEEDAPVEYIHASDLDMLTDLRINADDAEANFMMAYNDINEAIADHMYIQSLENTVEIKDKLVDGKILCEEMIESLDTIEASKDLSAKDIYDLNMLRKRIETLTDKLLETNIDPYINEMPEYERLYNVCEHIRTVSTDISEHQEIIINDMVDSRYGRRFD